MYRGDIIRHHIPCELRGSPISSRIEATPWTEVNYSRVEEPRRATVRTGGGVGYATGISPSDR